MSKKTIRYILISLGILNLLFLILNFGLNFWLKNNLPGYIKNNSDYNVAYDHLDVDLGTGNILATKISVQSKNPDNQNVIGISGTVDTLSISRMGIYDAVVNKRINSSNLLLVKPNLKVTLAKPIDDRTGRKRSPFLFENIDVKDGNITIYRHTQQKFIAVNDLHLHVENLQMTEESVEDKLPVAFDKYDIQGRNFYVRPDNVYALKSSQVTTKNGLMNVRDFQLIPLVTQAQFVRFYPQKANLFDFKATEMDFKDIVMTDNKLTLSQVSFKNPVLKLFTTRAKKQPSKSFKYEVNLDDVKMDKAKVLILKPDGNRLFASQELNLNISKLKMDENTAKGNIPFSYEKFLMRGKGLNYITKNQDVKVASMALDQRSGDLWGISTSAVAGGGSATGVNLNAKRLRFTLDEWQLKDNKLKLLANQVILDGANGTIISAPKQNKPKPDYSGIELPLIVKNISLKNSNLTFTSQNKPVTLNGLNANVSALEMNEETVKSGFPFKSGNYNVTARNLNYKIPFYKLETGLLRFNKKTLQLSNFAMTPTVSRAQFIRQIPTERDLYTLKAAQITANGEWDLLSNSKFLNASSVALSSVHANIFRSKVPADDPKTKPLYSELLRRIKFPLFINDLSLKNSLLEYEEDTKASEGPGKLTFSNFNMNVKNLNSGKSQGKPTQIPITVRCQFMKTSPMNVRWSIDTASPADAFTIAGNIANLPATSINAFIEPYLKIRATGNISDLIFNFRGNKNGLNGSLNLKHQNLKVSVLNKEGEKNKVLSAIANMVVRTNSGRFPESVSVDNVQRDPTKSFFNLFWKGIQEGLKKTLIGRNIENTEKKVKNTVDETKNTISEGKDKVQNTKADIKETTTETKENVGKVKGAFQQIFKKKKAE